MQMPRPLNYLTTSSPQKQGRDQERKVRQTIASGAVWFDKGDLAVEESDESYVIDSKKVVTQKTYTFSLKEIDKFYKQVGGKKTPVYMVYIGDYCLKCLVQRVGKNG
jgi:hypothetical protein